MKYTLLDMTQIILSSLDSDEVDTIGATVESRQVAEVIRTAYFNILARADLPEHDKLTTLNASLDVTKPTLMIKPENLRKVYWIKYNIFEGTGTDYDFVTIMPLEQFMQQSYNSSYTDPAIGSFELEGHTFFYKNDRRPTYCTLISDKYFVFDAYNAAEDSTLQESKIMVFGEVVPIFTMEDSFVPDMDERQFQLLLNEAKALAFYELKQTTHELANREATRQWRSMQRTKHVVRPSAMDDFANFGR